MAELENKKHERFCQEYILDLNATQAAIRAGYSVKQANSTGARLYAKVSIRARIDELNAAIQSKKIADATEVMEFLTAVIRGEKTEQVVMLDNIGSIVKADKTVGGREQVKAAELLAKRYGLLTDNVKVSGSAAVQIIDDLDGGGVDGD